MIKKILYISIWVVLSAGILVTLGFVSKEHSEMPCKSLEITIDNSDENYFVNEKDVEELLKSQGNTVVGKALKDINVPQIEMLLNNHPHILKADAYLTIDGILQIDVKQRKPILRVINAFDESFYIDENGKLMPLSDNFSAPVLLANGLIFETYGKFYPYDFSDTSATNKLNQVTILDDLYRIAKFTSRDTFWNAQIEQVFVDKEIELIPRIGNQRIILGENSKLPEKFKRLWIFYNEALPKTGWNAYSIINLKYEGQIVCTKAQK